MIAFLLADMHVSDLYEMKSVGYLAEALTFKKIQMQTFVVYRTECALKCTQYDACASFSFEEGACVFGLFDDVTEFANGENVTYVEWQYLKKAYFGNAFIYKFIYIYVYWETLM